MLYIDMTYKCNLNCLFCASAHTNTTYANNYQISFSEEFFNNNSHHKILHISGGEPTLCNNLIQFCKEAHIRNFILLLSTNALKCSDLAYAKKLIDTGLNCIIIPFLTLNEPLHDFIVGRKGAFKLLIMAYKNLMQLSNSNNNNTDIVLKVILLKQTIKQLHNLPVFLKKSKLLPKEIQISGLHLSGKVLKNSKIIPRAKQLSLYVSRFVRSLVEYRIPFSIYDFPWCILDNDVIESLLTHSKIHPNNEEGFTTKIYLRGTRIINNESYRFPECYKCELINFCNTYAPYNIKLIKDDISSLIRTVKFI